MDARAEAVLLERVGRLPVFVAPHGVEFAAVVGDDFLYGCDPEVFVVRFLQEGDASALMASNSVAARTLRLQSSRTVQSLRSSLR